MAFGSTRYPVPVVLPLLPIVDYCKPASGAAGWYGASLGLRRTSDILVHPAANLNPLEPVSGDKGFPLHGPAEWLRHGGIEIGDEALDPLLEMVLRCEIAAPEELSDQDREPNLDLVDP